MKKFFTLLVCALAAGSAFAQDGWTPVEGKDGFVQKEFITNGKIAYKPAIKTGDFSAYPATQLVNFKANDYPDGDEGAKVEVGTARVVVDPADAATFEANLLDEGEGNNLLNYCLEVGSHSNPANSWDSQFFITIGEENAFQEGDQVTLKMKVKAAIGTVEADAEKEIEAVDVHASSQTHNNPGGYVNNNGPGDVPFTTEWVDFEKTFTENSGYTIAFNLNEFKSANKYYFDEISIVVVREEAPTEDEDLFDTTIPEGWSNLIVNGNFEGEGTDNFVCHDYPDPAGAKNEMVAPRVIADPANASNKCIVVTTNASFKQDYDSQLFITVPEAQHFNEGDVIRLRMRVKADAAQTAGTQCHAAPGSYIFYQCAGDVKFKTVWTNFDSGEITVTKQMMQSNNNPGPFRTIALNLSKISAGNNVYFDEVQLLVKEPEDPTIGLKSDLSIAITKGSAASDYKKTEASYAAVTDAVAEGQLVLDDADATKEKLEAAIKAINDAFNGLTYVEGYTPVTQAMFKHYASVETPGEGSSTGCAYSLYESVDMPYGDATVSELNWADLSEYDELIVVKAGDTKPRILMNRLEKDGQQAATKEESKMLDINDNAGNTWSADAYQEIVDDNVFVINLKAIVEDFGFARLHSIKKQGWAAGVTVTDLIVGKGTATSISEAKVAKAAKAIYNVAGQQIKDLQKGLNIVDGKKVYVK